MGFRAHSKAMEGASELDRFDAELGEDMGDEAEEDPASAVERLARRLQYSDLPRRSVLTVLSSEGS